MSHRSLLEYLETFSRIGADTAIIHRRGYRRARWSYRQIAEAAAQFARELESRNIGRGDRVLLWGDNCAEWVVAFWGTQLVGAVVVPMDRIATPEFAGRVASQVDGKLLVSSLGLSLPQSGLPVLNLETLSQTLARHGRVPFRSPDISRADMAEIIFTSGTTAEPRGVVLTHGNILANLEPLQEEIAKYRRYERVVHPLRFLNLLPLSHVFGQLMGLFVPPLIGATAIFLDTLNPSEVVRACQRERITALVAVPRMLESLKERVERELEAAGRLDGFRRQYAAAERERVWWRIWRFRRFHCEFGWKFWAFVCGGARLDPDTEGFWLRLGFAVIQGYGLTETASLITLNHPFRMGQGSIGRMLAGREIQLAEDGEILVRGESVASVYWRGRNLEPVAEAEGWFRTGDLGALDAQGNLYFKGRKKNLIVTGAGMNIHPEDLEAALRRQPEVRDCVVIGISRNGEEEPCAVVVMRSEADPGPVVERANESLAEFQRMRLWRRWSAEDFPRTSTGKPQLHLIRQTVEAQLEAEKAACAPAAEPAAGAIAPSPLQHLIERITGRPAGPLRPDDDLQRDLNLNSLDRVELLSALEDRFQTDLSESRFSAATTVGELEELLREPVPTPSQYPYPRWPQWTPIALLRSFIYYLLVWPATMLMAWPRIRGREHLRRLRGPALFIANHVTEIDIGFVLAALPVRYRYRLAVAMMGERLRDLRHPPKELGLRRLVDPIAYLLVSALFNVFALPKQSGVRRSFQFAGESVDRGFSILVFPEGQLTPDGGIGEFRAGIGVLAKTLEIPVVPLRIDGLYELREAGKRLARPGRVRVTIGEPQRFHWAEEAEAIASRLRQCVEGLGSATS